MRILRSGHFWLILAVFALCSIFHYAEQIGIIGTVPPSSHFGLTRHALDRILFLLPIIYSTFVFGLTAGLVTSFAALVVMLPRALVISPVPADALLEIAGVLAVGVLASLWLWTRAREKKKIQAALAQLQSAHELLQHYVQLARSNEKRLTILNTISTTLGESLELGDVLSKAIHMVSELMEVEVALIFTLDEETQELMLVAYEGVSDEFVQAVDKIKMGEGVYGEVALTGQAVVVEDAARDHRLTRPEVQKMQIQTQLIVPLLVRDRVRGIVCVAMRRPRQFIHEDIELLTAVGTQIATAIENARLYEEERLVAHRLVASERNYRRLFEDASDAIWVHDLTGKIIAANKATEKLTGYGVEELTKMNVRVFLSNESLNLAGQIRHKLMENEPVEQPYEQSLIRKDGTTAILKLATSLITEDGKPTGFQHIARDITEERRMQDNLRYYLQEITRAQEEERKRIARELHDVTAQTLYALNRQVDNFLRGRTILPEDYAAFLRGLNRQIKELLQDVRRFGKDLRPPMLDDLGLVATLRWLVSELKEQHGIKTDLRVLGTERRFTPEAELLLFRIVQEAVRNIGRHSQASKAEVSIDFNNGRTRVTITDDGLGFRLPESLGDLSRAGKLGLIGMQERVRLLDGSLTVKSDLGKGTTLIVEAPI